MTPDRDGRPTPRLFVGVLGHCTLRRGDDPPLDLTEAQRRLIARLALGSVVPVDVDALADALWDGAAPRSSRASLHNQVSRLRQLVDDDLVHTFPGGYALATTVEVDAHRLTGLSRDAERHLLAGDLEQAWELCDRALTPADATPYADLDHLPQIAQVRRTLEATRYGTETMRLEAAVRVGRSAWAVQEGERLLAESPHDERRAELLARALHGHGRRGDALAVISATRRALRSDLGIEASAPLSAAEQRILTDDDTDRAVPSSTVFVGRDDDLARLVDAVATGDLVRLDADPGAGVSTLLRHLRRALADRRVAAVVARCPEFPESAVAVLTELLDDLGCAPVSQGIVEDFQHAVALRAAQGPLALLIDDAQFAGPTTRAALRSVAQLPGVSVLLAGHRLGPDPDGDHLTLAGLDETALADLVTLTTRRTGAERAALAASLLDLSGGNPLLARLILDEPDLTHRLRDAPQAPTGAAPHITAHIAARVRSWRTTLSARENDLLDWVAVADGEAPTAILADVVAGAVTSSPLLEVGGATARFRHGAVRHAVYDDLPAGRRAEMHHALGEASRRHALSPTTVAGHLWRAREIDPAAACGAAREAAEQASRSGAHREAADWLAAACSLVDAGDTREVLPLRIAHGDALRLAGDDRHLPVLVEAADAALDLGDEALLGEAFFALLQLGGSSDFGGNDERLRSLTERALGRIRDPDHAAPVLAAASLAWSMTGQADHARRLFEEAERSARRPETRRRVLPFTYLALGLPGDLERRRRLTAELTALGAEADDPIALFEAAHLAASVAMIEGDGAALRSASGRMGELLVRVGDVGRRWSALYTRAAIAHLDHDLEGSDALAQQALALFAGVSPERAMAAYQAQLLPLWLAQGRVAELREPLAQLVASQPGVPAWHAAYALTLTGGAEVDTALVAEQLRAALGRAEPDFTWVASHVIGGRAAALHGDPTLSAAYYDELAPWTGLACWQGTCSYGPVDTTLALLARSVGDAAACARHTAAAWDCATRLQAPVFLRDLESVGLAGG